MHTDSSSSSNGSRKRRLAGNILIFFGGLVLVGSALAKLAHLPKMVSELGAMGFDGNRLTAIAILEIASALLFMVRPTRSLGLLLISAYLGGAIATHAGHGSPWLQPAFVLSLLWLGAYLRHPVIFWSFSPSIAEAPTAASLEVYGA